MQTYILIVKTMNKKNIKNQIQGKIDNYEFYCQLKRDNLILFEVITGSNAYGTNTETSDVDIKFVFIPPPEYKFNLHKLEQVNVNKDFVGYEFERFLSLLYDNNPTILEMLFVPNECIRYKHILFQDVLDNKEKFLTKKCENSFGGYAKEQYNKAKGQNKMMNWEREKVKRKTPMDFCYVIEGSKTRKLRSVLEEYGYEQKFCGVSNVPNARDLYSLFYDYKAHICFSELVEPMERDENKSYFKERGEKVGLGYKGIEKCDGESNELRLSSIPKKEKVLFNFSYNKDGYINHCKDYNNYQQWLKERNDNRWVDVNNHGQKIDGKNLMHCMRLITMAVEIAEGKELIVKREDRDYLLDIKNGKYDLKILLDSVGGKINGLREKYGNSGLPEEVDLDFVNGLLCNVYMGVYKI